MPIVCGRSKHRVPSELRFYLPAASGANCGCVLITKKIEVGRRCNTSDLESFSANLSLLRLY
jgi:hypothetical protein